MSAGHNINTSAYRAILKALQLSRHIAQAMAADERSEHYHGPARKAEAAIDRAERLLGVHK